MGSINGKRWEWLWFSAFDRRNLYRVGKQKIIQTKRLLQMEEGAKALEGSRPKEGGTIFMRYIRPQEKNHALSSWKN